jgi:hypothetical protein
MQLGGDSPVDDLIKPGAAYRLDPGPLSSAVVPVANKVEKQAEHANGSGNKQGAKDQNNVQHFTGTGCAITLAREYSNS